MAERMYVLLAALQQVSGHFSAGLCQSNSSAITTRFETRYFEAALPRVLHEYDVRHSSVGLMLRLTSCHS